MIEEQNTKSPPPVKATGTFVFYASLKNKPVRWNLVFASGFLSLPTHARETGNGKSSVLVDARG
jgi:hypothetical protein